MERKISTQATNQFKAWGAEGKKKAEKKLIKRFGKNYHSEIAKLGWVKRKQEAVDKVSEKDLTARG